MERGLLIRRFETGNRNEGMKVMWKGMGFGNWLEVRKLGMGRRRVIEIQTGNELGMEMEMGTQ